MSDLNIKPILEWFQQAKPNPTIGDACVQIGCHYEEVDEMLAINHDNEDALSDIANAYKSKDKYSLMSVENTKGFESMSIKMLDALCDQIVTAIGVAHMMGFNIEKALEEVNRSNWSKFVDGKPQFNEQGKITKPESYSPPELSEFIK